VGLFQIKKIQPAFTPPCVNDITINDFDSFDRKICEKNFGAGPLGFGLSFKGVNKPN